MMTITKEFNWAMAHLLEGHEGLCKNIHGHNYKLMVTVKRLVEQVDTTNKSSKGMVVDFKDLKNIVNEVIVDRFDHAFVFNGEDEESTEIADYLSNKLRQKILPLAFRTTAENMVKWIFVVLNVELEKKGLRCVCATLYETPTSYASYSKDG